MRDNPVPNYDSQSTDVRSYFDKNGCHVHGHPSSGGILIKKSVNLVDLQFLSLPRLAASKRSYNHDEEDAFCELLRRIGAKWWKDEAAYLMGFYGVDAYDGDPDDHEKDPGVQAANEARARQIVTFGWPTDGVGVWVLSCKNKVFLPQNYKMIDFAVNMEERIEVMKDFGAKFVEDPSLVQELQEPWSSKATQNYLIDDEESSTSSSSSEYEALRCTS